MTDNDIIKALEFAHCNAMHGDCLKCPYLYEKDCAKNIPKDALDLINRQKAEIERLNKDIDIIQSANVELYSALDNARAEVITEFEKRAKEKAFLPLGTWCAERVITENDIDQIAKELKGEQ